jgi:hypothetical protein
MRVRVLAIVTVSLFGPVAHSDPKRGGFWCWTHQDGQTAACAPQEDQCKASLAGFNQVAAALREPQVTGTCVWQKNAWQLILKVPPKPPRYFPTKKMCTAGLSKGESCKEVR